MGKKLEVEKLKEEIESKRKELNEVVSGDLDRAKILRFSQELDVLIVKYYALRLK